MTRLTGSTGFQSRGVAPALRQTVMPTNRFSAPSAAGRLSYDAAGSMTSDGLYGYAYNAQARQTSAAGVTYTYDGDGRRVKKENGKLYWYGLGGEVLTETDLGGNYPTEYVFFGGRRIARRDPDPSGTVYYYFGDHLGTSRVIVQAGQTAACYEADYYPYGGERVITDTCPQNYKFTGKERDPETQNDYFGARYHASNLGRFLHTDPGPFLWTDPQTLNRYAYTRNNPLKFVDPTGRYFVISPSDPHYAQFLAAIAEMLLSPRGRAAVQQIVRDPRPSFYASGSIRQEKGKITTGTTEAIPTHSINSAGVRAVDFIWVKGLFGRVGVRGADRG